MLLFNSLTNIVLLSLYLSVFFFFFFFFSFRTLLRPVLLLSLLFFLLFLHNDLGCFCRFKGATTVHRESIRASERAQANKGVGNVLKPIPVSL